MRQSKTPKKFPLSKMLKYCCWLVFSALIIFVLVVHSRQPSNTRNWEEEFAVQPSIFINDNLVTINSIRDWRYSEDEIISKNYISRTYDISKLKRMWFVLEPFGGWKGVAHTYFIFDFEDQEPVVFSIEARREKGEIYGALKGLLNNFETIYIWGTEEDLTARRVVYQKNNLYMFPVNGSNHFEKSLFLELAHQTQKLSEKPRFYNTLTSNCTNNLANHANAAAPGTIPYHYSRMFTGFSGEFLYNLGYIPTNKPYEEIEKDYYINNIVNEIYGQSSFSQLLREKLDAQSSDQSS